MMNYTNLISAWNQLLLQFLPLFTEPTATTFTRMATAWVLATGRRSICGIFWFVEPSERRAHDAYHRFFPDGAWSMDDLWQTWTCFVVGKFYPARLVPLILDDTLFHKTGRKVDGAGWWRDAVRSTHTRVVYALGLNLVVICLRVDPPWGGEPISLPIHMRLHRKGGPGPLELAKEMIRQIANWLPHCSFCLTCDGFYAPLAGCKLERTTLISRMRRDGALYDLAPKKRKGQRGRPRKKGHRLPTPQATAPHVRNWKRITINQRGRIIQRLIYTRIVLWYGVCGSTPIKLLIVRDPDGKEPDDFFFTTDVDMPEEKVAESFYARWSIEDTFKNTKQLLGGQQPQVWKAGGPQRAAAFSLLLYSLIWTWYLTHGHRSIRFHIPSWYRQKKRPSFQDALSALRKTIWRSRLFPKSGNTPAPTTIIQTLIEAAAYAA